jgi:hypothetical protein
MIIAIIISHAHAAQAQILLPVPNARLDFLGGLFFLELNQPVASDAYVYTAQL